MTDPSRRFTDREVALVLDRAAEMDEAEPGTPATGLSLAELTNIAREVGISPASVERAVASLDRGRAPRRSLAGAPLVRKAAHSVPSALDRSAIAELVRVVDDETDTAGSVSEALGSVRWTSADRLRSSRVSFTPSEHETSIEVVEKAAPRLRLIFQALPAAWAVMLATPALAAFPLPAATTTAVALAAAGLGGLAGRAAWALMSQRSAVRVRRLARRLAEAASGASRSAPGT